MKQEKQQLLKQHRRKKRVLLGSLLLATLALGALVSWWLILALPLAAWIAHEAWFSDHLFYRAKSDYDYRFDAARETELAICNDKLLAHEHEAGETDTRIIELHVKGSWLSPFHRPVPENRRRTLRF
jgi:hypothetical protein